MNCVIDPTLDRSSSRAVSPSKMSQTVCTLMDQFGCIDTWGFVNATSRQYSFFSHAHRSFSRIDYFVVDKNIISSLISAQYLPITVSDHSTVTLDLRFDLKPKQYRSWRLDPLLLSKEAFCKVISEEITFFCDTNKNDGTSPSLLWESLKAFIRGKIISYTSHLNKQRRKRKENLETSIADLDSSLAVTNTPNLYKQRLKLQTELNLLLTADAEHIFLYSKGLAYEHGEKASRLLAHQLKARQASNQIIQIRDESNIVISDPNKINSVFQSYRWVVMCFKLCPAACSLSFSLSSTN